MPSFFIRYPSHRYEEISAVHKDFFAQLKYQPAPSVHGTVRYVTHHFVSFSEEPLNGLKDRLQLLSLENYIVDCHQISDDTGLVHTVYSLTAEECAELQEGPMTDSITGILSAVEQYPEIEYEGWGFSYESYEEKWKSF